jgi:hypothetical protein
MFAQANQGLEFEPTFAPLDGLGVKLVVPLNPSLMLIQVYLGRGDSRFRPIDSGPNGGNLLINELNRIYEVESISEMTSVLCILHKCISEAAPWQRPTPQAKKRSRRGFVPVRSFLASFVAGCHNSRSATSD